MNESLNIVSLLEETLLPLIEADEVISYLRSLNERGDPEKFKQAKTLSDNLNNIRTKWMRDLNNDNSPNQLPALMLELSYQTSARIGTLGNQSDGKPTFGLTTLRKEHVTVSGNTATLKYVGKKGILNKHVVNSAKISKLMKKFKNNASSGDWLFRSENGRISAKRINSYLKELGVNVTVHKFRHLRATEIFKAEVAKSSVFARKGLTKQEVMSEFKRITELIGSQLNHVSGKNVTGATAIKNYIEPKTMLKVFKKQGIDPPKSVMNLFD